MQFGFWRQRASITIFFFLVALAPQAGLADVLVGESAVMYGHVLSANASHVIFKAGCDGNVTKSAPWSEVRSIVFDAECKEHEAICRATSLRTGEGGGAQGLSKQRATSNFCEKPSVGRRTGTDDDDG